MSFFNQEFNANTVDPLGAFEPLPEGNYKVMISSAKEKPTRDGTGSLLELVYKVAEGKHKNREVFDHATLRNRSEKAVEIGMRKLSALCHATGVLRLQRPAQLVGKTITVKIGVREREDKPGVFSNEVKGVILQDVPQQAAQTDTTASAGGGDVEAPAWG